MTPAEFDAVTDYDDNYHYELIHGVLVVHAIPKPSERDPNEELGLMLRMYQRHHPQGKALDKTLPEEHVHLPHSRRRADRVIWAGLGRVPNPKKDLPAIVVEFVSEGKRDRDRDYIEKRDEYHKAGVREYWIIDRFRREITVFRFASKTGKAKEILVGEKETYESPLLPGFQLPLAQLLSAADDWKDYTYE